MTDLKGPNFEDNTEFIQQEIAKRRGLWHLSSITWLDFDDVSQMILLHIFEKWETYNQSKPLGPWLNKVIANQIHNIVRNIYGNYARPCLRCHSAEGENLCKIYGTQCSKCPLYAIWEKTKKQAMEVKVPLPIDTYLNNQEIGYHDEQNIDSAAKQIHKKMEKTLKPTEWIAYKCLFIENLSEEETARKLGFKSNEKGRSAGYKQLRNIRKIILQKVKKAIQEDQIDIL